MTPSHPRIVVELPADDPGSGSVVLAAALFLLDHDAEIVLCLTGVDEPTQEQALYLSRLCSDLVPAGARMADVLVLGVEQALGDPCLLHVVAGQGAGEDARAVILVSALADLTDVRGGGLERESSTSEGNHQAPALRRAVEERVRRRDRGWGAPRHVPVVVAVAQVMSTWGALDSVCRALADRTDVRLEVVALGSQAEQRDEDVVEFLKDRGYQPRDLAWFRDAVSGPGSQIDLVLFDNQYDGLRPVELRSTTLAEQGIRTALVPYGNNVGAGDEMHAMQYDTSLHRMGWRVFARSTGQHDMFGRYCSVGADHVRVLGLPKLDRVVTLTASPVNPFTTAAGGRPVVLWNPHFSLGHGGWSTFDRYLVPMIDYFVDRREMLLVVRPHFRLANDAELVGGVLKAMMDHLAAAAELHENILIDHSSDYLEAFAAATAMVSDLSSLITEFLPTGKPVLYLHRQDGPGVNEDAEYVFSTEVAMSWAGVKTFLDDVAEGVDRGTDRRRLALERHFGHLDGHSGERVAEELAASLRRELDAVGAEVGGGNRMEVAR